MIRRLFFYFCDFILVYYKMFKCPKSLTVSDQYFLSYVRKTTRVGSHPAGHINEKEIVEDHISVEY